MGRIRQSNEDDPLTRSVIGAAIEVHRWLGPGLLESAYQVCLSHELTVRGIAHETEVKIPIFYKDVHLDCGYRLDILIPGQLVVELKSVLEIHPIHHAQILTYLRLTGIPRGLLLNFNVPVLKDGMKRFAL